MHLDLKQGNNLDLPTDLLTCFVCTCSTTLIGVQNSHQHCPLTLLLLPHFLLLHSQVIATLTTSAEAKSAKARRRQSLTSSQGSQDTNREKGHDEAESVASSGNLNGVKGKDKKKLLSVAFD
jgi:hypothetical protein